MAEELPNFIELRRLVDERPELRGVVSPERLSRLPAPFRAVAPLDLHLRFDAEQGRRIRVRGRLKTDIDAVCQRCLNDMRIAVDRDIDVVLVSDEPDGAAADEADDDFIVVADGHWRLAEFAEDELILACPMIPAHAQADCPVQLEKTEAADERRKPFAGLAALLADDERKPGD